MSMNNADVDKKTDRTHNVRFLTEIMLGIMARGLEVELDEFSTKRAKGAPAFRRGEELAL